MPPVDPRLMQQPGAPPPDQMPPEPPAEEQQDTGPETPAEDQNDAAIPPAVGDQQEGITPASPEEQAQKDHFVKKAWELIYSDQMWPQILQMLEGGADDTQQGDPVQGLATATEMVFARVAQASEQAGEVLAPDAAYNAGADILEELAEVSTIGKIHDYANDPDGLEKAWFVALDMFRERLQSAGEIDQGQAKGDLDKLMSMDQNGTLERIMRDLAASDQSGEAGGPGGEHAPPGFKPKGLGVAAEKPARRPAGVQ